MGRLMGATCEEEGDDEGCEEEDGAVCKAGDEGEDYVFLGSVVWHGIKT